MAPTLPRNHSSFCKVMFGDFIDKVRIPPAFTVIFRDTLLGEDQIVLSEAHSGKSWQVAVDKVDRCRYFLTGDGWCTFARDQNLEEWDFLVFLSAGEANFQVIVYDHHSCCLKNSHMQFPRDDQNSHDDVDRASGNVGQAHHYFEMIISKSRRYYVSVPKAFAEDTGIRGRGTAVVKDPRGKRWRLPVMERSAASNRRIDLGKGWCNVVGENMVADGDKLCFTFAPAGEEEEGIIHLEITPSGGAPLLSRPIKKIKRTKPGNDFGYG